jgi:hypothetical protein
MNDLYRIDAHSVAYHAACHMMRLPFIVSENLHREDDFRATNAFGKKSDSIVSTISIEVTEREYLGIADMNIWLPQRIVCWTLIFSIAEYDVPDF